MSDTNNINNDDVSVNDSLEEDSRLSAADENKLAAEAEKQELSEIEKIQAAIEGNDDPVVEIVTAAGTNLNDGGSSSAVSLLRDGAETIASTDFNTDGFNLSEQSAVISETIIDAANLGPTISTENGSIDEDGGSVTLSYTAVDIDGTIVLTTAEVPAHQGTVTINESDGTITFTPAANFHGDAIITLVTTDNDGATATTSSTIHVTDVDDKSEITVVGSDSDSGAVTEDFEVDNGQLKETGSLTLTDVDTTDNTTFNNDGTFKTAGSTNPTALGELTIDADGDWSYAVDNSKVQYL
ncbi:Ig-like domain-containing protein, partial [Psychromonas ossibalaenae]|uniref:Ig-like domain-containing protein n=1 Tax=Psychromonas ossibalaenae TaxID=444922 RepID=UPI0005242C16